jgi:dienelactone hydrolase
VFALFPKGVPYPLNELNAAEAVFEYATKELGFKDEDIVLYGWSIGGYPAAYLASQHPNIKGVVRFISCIKKETN